MLQNDHALKQGRYKITRQAHKNGRSAMYEAVDTEAKKPVRVIAAHFAASDPPAVKASRRSSFDRYAQAVSKITNENFASVNDHFADDSGLYLILDLTEGISLRELAKNSSGAFNTDEVLKWADQLLNAVKAFHAQVPPVFHLDISPSQIWLTSGRTIQLLPSASRDIDDDSELSGDAQTELHFLPLEQIWKGLDPASQKVIENSYDERSADVLKQPADERSDIFSAAATLYFLAAGKLPVDALERTIEMLDGKDDPLRSASDVSPNVPREFSDVLMKAMSIRREDRFDSSLIMHQIVRTAVARSIERRSEPQADAAAAAKISEEQQRLENERRRVEETRLKLEAEQKRLELEREAIERKKRELEEERKQKAAPKPVASAPAQKPAAQPSTQVTFSVDDSDVLQIEAVPIVTATVVETPAEPILNLGDIDQAPKEEAPRAFVTDDDDASLGGIFAAQEPSGSSMKIPAIIGGIVLVIGTAIGAWMMMGSGDPAPAPAAVVQAPTPASVPSAEPTPFEAASQAPIETAPTEIPAEIQPAADAAPAAQPKPRKQVAAAKPQAEKKSVTVDDIINDN